MTTPEVVVLADAAAVAAEAARRWIAIAREAAAQRGVFTVALAGGATPEALYRLLALPEYRDQTDWGRTHIYFGDERCVPPEDPRSNYRMAYEALLGRVPLAASHVHRMQGELPGARAARVYEELLRRSFELSPGDRPRLDLVILGLGADGHTASLFPGMPALDEAESLAVFTHVPDYVNPRVPRLTLTLPVLNAAAHVLFLVTGSAKAGAVSGALAGAGPAGLVRPTGGALAYLLDTGAASLAVAAPEGLPHG
jgi:6-phosphogluconolactonase